MPVHANDVEAILADRLRMRQADLVREWGERPQQAVIALVRVLDTIAASRLRPNNSIDGLDDSAFYAMLGAAAALEPFLASAAAVPGGLPWQRSRTADLKRAHEFLADCGKLAHLHRFAQLARYGLAETEVIGACELRIRVRLTDEESAARLARTEIDSKPAGPRPGGEHPARRQRRILRRMLSYVDSDQGWFIRYENDFELVREYRIQAQEYGATFPEAEAFPADARIGGRSFGDWREACDHALGRVLCHIDFCRALALKCPKIHLPNVLTIYSRHEDVGAVWRQAGLAPELVESTVAALTATSSECVELQRAHEIPTPFYIRVGEDFALLPVFGSLLNPYYSLFRHLRNAYRSDWDRQVERREAAFRSELASFLDPRRFHVPAKGYVLRRPDNSILTDIDAVAVDRRTGTLALFQLKWQDVFGRSLSERESRKSNIAKAEEWVSRVRDWAGTESSASLCARLGLPRIHGGDAQPVIFVLARYVARFTGSKAPDDAARWLSWDEFRGDFARARSHDALRDIGLVRPRGERRDPPSSTEIIEVGGLQVHLDV